MHEAAWIEKYIAPLVRSDGAEKLRDDVALLTVRGPTVATMDTLVEGIHFLPDDPRDTIGQKLIRVNVSDIHAKGAAPGEALLSIAWPRGWPDSDFQHLMTGIGRDLERFKVALVGGDLVGTDGPLTLTLTLTGNCLADAPIRRSGGAPGEGLFVNGEIGWGGIGLDAAKTAGDPEIAKRYRVPEISPFSAAQAVAEHGTASLDVSDGLLIDASRLAKASQCGVLIELDQVPLAAPTSRLEDMLAQCTSGDDYRILMTVPQDQSPPGFTRIGELTPQHGLSLRFQGQEINPPSTLGFEH